MRRIPESKGQMAFHPGQRIWVHFPGLLVEAVVVEVGSGEVRVREEGSSVSEWVPVSWCNKVHP